MLRGARIVATIKRGGAIAEEGNFVFNEGRHPTSFSDDDPNEPPQLRIDRGFEGGALTAAEWLAQMEHIDPKPSQQYLRATQARDLEGLAEPKL